MLQVNQLDKNMLTEAEHNNIDMFALNFLNQTILTNSKLSYTPIKNITRDSYSLETVYDGICKIVYGKFYTDGCSLIFDDLIKEDNLKSTVMTGMLTRSAKATLPEETLNKIYDTIEYSKTILENNNINLNRVGDFIALTKSNILKPSILFDVNISQEYGVKNVSENEAIVLLKSEANLKTIMLSIITGMSLEDAETISEAPSIWATTLVSPELVDNKQFLKDELKTNVENAARAIRREKLAKGKNLTVNEMKTINQKTNNKVYGNGKLIFAYYDYHPSGWQFTVEGKNSDISSSYSYKYDSLHGSFKETL